VAIDGLITVRSNFSHSETLVRFEAAVRANGSRVVASVDHPGAAPQAGLQPDTTTVLTVEDGSRQAMLVNALRWAALDLPFRVLVWRDASGTWLSYADFRWLAKRYGAGTNEVCLFTDMAVLIDGIARKARLPP
jgi:uncharacterized protein (DUF302 family)